jgi:hypothetical protein
MILIFSKNSRMKYTGKLNSVTFCKTHNPTNSKNELNQLLKSKGEVK